MALWSGLRAMWDAPPFANARAELAARDAETLESQIAVSEIAAPTGEESERGTWIASRFRALGLTDVRRDSAGNVTARGRAPKLPHRSSSARISTRYFRAQCRSACSRMERG